MSYNLSVKILVYSRYVNVVDYLSHLAIKYNQVLFEINDDSGFNNHYPCLDNVLVTYTNRVGHDQSYLQLLGSEQKVDYGYVISDAVILTCEMLASILARIQDGSALYVLSCKSISQFDIYWFVTKTGFIVYKAEYLKTLVIDLPNFPQLNFLSILARNDIKRISVQVSMMDNKKSYWIENMYNVWFEDFSYCLEKFMPAESAKIVVRRHAIMNKFFTIPNLFKWGIMNTIKAFNYYLLK